MTLDLYPQSSSILARPTGGFGSSATSLLVEIGCDQAEPRPREAAR